jgi:hydroxymethylbilane synthase
MPLAAFAEMGDDGLLRLRAALGDGERPERPLLHVQVQAPVADGAAARALGDAAAAQLRAAGAAGYLPPA